MKTERVDLLKEWAGRLAAAAGLTWRVWLDQSARAEDLVRDFRDDAGHRRAVDPVFLGAIRGVEAPRHDSAGDDPPDVAAWRATAAGAPIAGLSQGLQSLTARGDEPIEIWTETELCVLHATWRAARLGGDEDLRARCLAAARWHLEHIQPDNATNHPWAIHVFAILAAWETRSDAVFHVGQMLHASLVRLGRPDRLSGHILEDAAGELILERDRLQRSCRTG